VDAGVQMVHRTQEAIGGIVRQVSDINDAIAGIARDTGEQAVGLDRLTLEIGSVSEHVASNASLASRAGEGADELHTVILELGRTVREFRIERQNRYADARRPAAPRPQPTLVPIAPMASERADDGEYIFQKRQGIS